MDLLIGGQWCCSRSGEIEEVRSPYDGSVVDTVPTAGLEDVEAALKAAERGPRRGGGRRVMSERGFCGVPRSWPTSVRRSRRAG
jgi:acyl-CoA reductase-like NAD-dependent aldehyde dehydrogenase